MKLCRVATSRSMLLAMFILSGGCTKYLAEEKANRDDYYNALAGYPTWYKHPVQVATKAKTWSLKPSSVYADTKENLA